MNKKIILVILIMMIVIFPTVNIYAANSNGESVLNSIISKSKNLNGKSTSLGSNMEDFIKDNIIPIVGVIGNLIFAGVTVILGMKYIWSSAEGKASVLESLPSFVIAVIMFYLAESLVSWLSGSSIGSIAKARKLEYCFRLYLGYYLLNCAIWFICRNIIFRIKIYVCFGSR